MYRVAQPSPSGGYGTVTLNCTENTADCLPLCPGGTCVDYAAPPPPLPPLPRATVDVDHRLPVRLLLTASLLSAFLFLSLALATLLLYRRRRALRRRRRLAAAAALPHGEGFDDEEAGGGGGGGVVHHVWYIRTVGLDEAAIASIAAVEYRGAGSGGDCAVCLGEFTDGELVRLLPRCSHPFHAPCIDTWLRAHVSCPVCRSSVLVPSTNVLAVAAASDADTAGSGAAEEHQVFDEMSPSESLPEDSHASSDTQSEDTAEAAADDNESATPKPIRRSASMDSPLFLVAVPEAHDGAVQSSRKLRSGREMRIFRVKDKEAAGTSSSSCQTGKFGIGRSMSSSGRAFFFSRNVRSTGTVLPL